MGYNIPSLDLLIHELTRLPGIGEKTAQRLAFFILKRGSEYSEKLQEALQQVNANVHPCPTCFSYTDRPICKICDDLNRDRSLVCVVEEPSDVVRIEGMGSFRGLYHVLEGTISPLEGVGPDDLRIQELQKRIEPSGEQEAVREVILALDADLEGDTTALYLAKVLPKSVKLTRLAHGVPFGSDIDYIDSRTLGRAFENRVEL
jgi:recombination protein RecR